MREATYAVYKGDEFVAMGTAKELSKELGCKPDTIRWYTYPSAKKRTRKNGIAVEKVT